MSTATLPNKKPSLRGVSHFFASFVAALGGVYLLLVSPSGSRLPIVVYSLGLVSLFAISAFYHRPNWQESVRTNLKRLDHSSIFIFIAATYTPICVLALKPAIGSTLLISVWGCAAVGVIRTIFWPGAPRIFNAILFVAMGWLVIGSFSYLPPALGSQGVFLLALGGILYTAGAIFYALKWPNPFPGIFGYHEVFHALVILAATSHFAVIRSIVV